MPKSYFLSKSKILSGLQCEKRLWLEIHKPELREDGAATQFKFSMGNNVGEVAQRLVLGGCLIGWGDGLSEALAETKRMIAESPKTPLFEATFSHAGVLIRADIFFKVRGGFRMVEVKGSTSVKDYYLNDCAVQYWVAKGAGYPIKVIELAHVDNSFVYQGDQNYQGILKHVDVTKEVLTLQKDVPKWVRRFKKLLVSPMPKIDVGDHCSDPYECPFCAHCWPEGPEYPLSILPRASQKLIESLNREGFEDIRDIPKGVLSSEKQELVRIVTISGKPFVSKELCGILSSLPFPRYYLDFETIGTAVPIWKGTRPYQVYLPFQWSCHIEDKSGNLRHEGYLDLAEKEPMRPLAEKMIKILGKKGAILTYSSFENSVLSTLADFLPDLSADLVKLQKRIVDLLPIMRANYYHPDMLGSWSIKAVLPTIAPDLDYCDLHEVADGTAAQTAYSEALSLDTSDARRQELFDALWEYCKMDTWAMVKIVKNLSANAA